MMIRKLWKDFWYEYIPDDWGSYGGTCNGKYRFREERLIYLILFILFIFGILT